MSIEQWLKHIGDEVKKLRGGEIQESFADRVGLSRQELSIIENGSRSYGIESLIKIFAATRRTKDQFGTLSEPDRKLLEGLQVVLDRGDVGERLILSTLIEKWEREAQLKQEGGDAELFLPRTPRGFPR